MSLGDLIGIDRGLAGEVEDGLGLEPRPRAQDPAQPVLGDRAVALD
ncbi:MAG: hypothetical protein JWN22_1101, partial [Nocardioides sp.]|nr:hypothetical protein [Nocardioides sp.]